MRYLINFIRYLIYYITYFIKYIRYLIKFIRHIIDFISYIFYKIYHKLQNVLRWRAIVMRLMLILMQVNRLRKTEASSSSPSPSQSPKSNLTEKVISDENERLKFSGHTLEDLHTYLQDPNKELWKYTEEHYDQIKTEIHKVNKRKTGHSILLCLICQNIYIYIYIKH